MVKYNKRYLYKGGILMKKYLPELNIFEKIIYHFFGDYTYKVYRKGYIDGYNWAKKMKY